MHATQRRRDSPQALLAYEPVVAVGHFDAAGWRVDVVRAHVRRPQLEGLPHLIQRAAHLPVGPGERPLRQRCGRGSRPRPRGYSDFQRLRAAPDLRNRSGVRERIRNPKPEGAGRLPLLSSARAIMDRERWQRRVPGQLSERTNQDLSLALDPRVRQEAAGGGLGYPDAQLGVVAVLRE